MAPEYATYKKEATYTDTLLGHVCFVAGCVLVGNLVSFTSMILANGYLDFI